MTDNAILLLGCSVSMLTLGAGYMYTRNHFLASFRPRNTSKSVERLARNSRNSGGARDAGTASPAPLYAAPQELV